MGEERQISGVSADSPVMLDHQRCVLRDGIGQLTSPIMPMNVTADGVTPLDVRGPGGPGFVAGNLVCPPRRRALPDQRATAAHCRSGSRSGVLVGSTVFGGIKFRVSASIKPDMPSLPRHDNVMILA